MAAHNGAAFLPRTLAALRDQTRLIDRFVGVDASSTDGSADLLRKQLPSDSTLLEVPEHSFGHSVMAAVQSLGKPRPGRTEWLWLIHDDSVPELNALEKLLTVVEATESVTIAGCKQLDLDSPRRLLDVGLGVNKYAERLTLIEIDEVDQGQYDARTDSFAVTSAGMLIRRDVFEALEGFDPALPGLGDDMDLCWRNRLMGNRVVIVPAAKIHHKAAVVRAVAGPAETRRAEVFMRLKHAPAWAIPFLVVGAVLGGIYRFLLSVLAKDPAYAFGQLGATFRAVGKPVKLSRSRATAAATRRVPRKSISRLLTDQDLVREHRKNMLDSLDGESVYGDGTGATATQDPSGDARNDFAALAAPNRTSAFVSAIIAVLATLAVSLVGLRALFGAGAVAGGAMLPISAKPSEIFANATSWWANLGAGSPAGGDPIDYLYWLASLAGGGNANAVAVVLTLLAMPLAALGAWLGLAAVTRSRAARMLGALLWGLAPSLQVSLASGRTGSVLVHVLAPLFLLALLRSVGAGVDFRAGRGRASRPGVGAVPSWTAAAAAALLLVPISAGSPAAGLVLVLLILLAAIVLRSRAKTLWWVPLPMLVFHLPLVIASLGNPRVLLTDPGLALPFAPAPLWAQGLGFPTAFDPLGTPAGFGFLPAGPWALVLVLLVGAPLLGFALTGLFAGARSGSTPLARMLWLGGVLMLAAGYGASLVPSAVAGDNFVAAFNGPFVSFFVLALLFAAGLGISVFRGEREPLAPGVPGARRVATGTLAWASALLGVSVLVAGGSWIAAQIPAPAGAAAQSDLGATSALRPVSARTLPATAADRGLGAYEDRTLVLAQNGDGAVSAALMNGAGTTADSLSQTVSANRVVGNLLAPALRESDDAERLIEQTVATLVSDSALDPREELAALGTGFVVLQDSRATASALVARLDAVPGLVPVGQTESGWLWRVEPRAAIPGVDNATDSTSRVRIVAGDKTVALLPSHRGEVSGARIEPGEAGRVLAMAERADAGWSATLDGVPLKSLAVGADAGQAEDATGTGVETAQWAQGFELGAAGGTLELHYHSPYKVPVAIAQLVVLLLALLLVIPIPRSRRFAARRLDEYRTRGNAESIDELDRGNRPADAKEKK
ncbi:glycosyltransferase family 2 protein [Paeniglutamicibacter sp. ABSL32-1]|uniref:glycosyltransferase n=1 Tax=Paeniglutamicibacter quisquiliarum TaxID=2849498 RepID=UPI001C2D868F|nr:glycosyltransferase family 2 protein [Paeniglutamicibacter quisquiliarum]